jgi:Kef-type K+ transport system membrane component KefB
VLVALAIYSILHFDLPSALVIGAIALPTAPVVALSIHQEYKTDGPVTRALLPIVAIDDVFAVATFGIILSLPVHIIAEKNWRLSIPLSRSLPPL